MTDRDVGGTWIEGHLQGSEVARVTFWGGKKGVERERRGRKGVAKMRGANKGVEPGV